MKHKLPLWRMALWLCIFLMLCYPLMSFISYYHSCTDEECAVCRFVEITRKTLTLVLVSALYIGLARLIYDSVRIIPKRLFYKNGTPVLQKIKLSD